MSGSSVIRSIEKVALRTLAAVTCKKRKGDSAHMKKLTALALSLALLLGMTACAPEEATEDSQSPAPTESAAPSLYTPGTYTAEAQGFGGTVTVTLTVDENSITAVEAVGDSETDGVGSKAIESLPDAILAAQSTEVDTVSGATVTSTAVLEAASSALRAARGEESAAVTMAPGTYTVEEYGFQQIQPVTVSVEVDEDSILSVEIGDNKESVAMVRSVETYLVPRILEYQSVAVDAVTGATATSNAVLTAVWGALTQALEAGGSDASALEHFQTPETKVDSAETLDVDVLVVGLGAAGTAACLSAAEAQSAAGQEVSVLGIDRAGRWGGTGAFTGSIMAVNAPEFKEEFNDGQDYMDGQNLYDTWLEYTEGDAREDIIKMFLDNSGDTIDWLFYDHGMLLNEPIAYFGSTWNCVYDYVSRNTWNPDRDYADTYGGTEATDGQNTMVDKYYQRLYDDFEALGGQYMLETEAYELIYDQASNTVTGVKARAHDGTEYTINAGAVILATGGFGGNGELEMEYLSQNPYHEHLGDEPWQMIGMYQNTGLMFQAAVDIGAGTYNADMPPMVHFAGSNIVLHDYPVNTRDDGTINLWYGWDYTWSLNDVPTALVLSSYCPWVDADGDRFEAEGSLFGWWQAGPSYWAVYSQDLIDDIAANGFPANITTYCNGSQGGVVNGVPIPEMQDILDPLVASGQILKAGSLEELADLMGVDQATFLAQMEDYESYCQSGTDEQYGKAAEKLLSLGEGPYYAIKGYSHAFCTCGGLDINADLQVLQADGETPINGLYAVGNESGGVLYSNKKPYVTYGGAALGWAYTSGRLAGGYAVEFAADEAR